ncbi:MAG: hypothetical protein WKF71_13095 [Pyrinomonadaceae bacterium]
MSNKMQNLLKQAEQQAKSSDPEESSVTCSNRTFSNDSEAEDFFAKLKEKLLCIKEWNAESVLTSYELFDASGTVCQRKTAAIGDFIRLSLHGSGKYDWVKIIAVDDAPDEIVLSVKPSFNPTEKQPKNDVTSHFFTSEATNNFCVRRKENIINFCVIGLNEQTNTEETKNFVETARNFATANIGSYFGIQKAEWKIFCENFLETRESENVKE